MRYTMQNTMEINGYKEIGEQKSLITTSSTSNNKVMNKHSGPGRIIYSACLFGAYFVIGWTYEQTGIALLDLQHISRVSLNYASFYLTVVNIAQIFGSLLSSFLYGRVNTSLLMCVNSIGVAVAVTSVPWCYTFSSMLITHCAHGVFGGSLDQVILAETSALWGSDSHVPMQTWSFVYACGNILSPLCTTPFLMDCNKSTPIPINHGNMDVTQYSNVTNLTTNNYHINCSSELYIPYSISGILCLAVALSFMLWFLLAALTNSKDLKVTAEIPEIHSSSMKFKLLILTITGVMTGLDIGIEESYGFFLTIFSVSHMGWTKLKGGFITSLFYLSHVAGQFIVIFLAFCCKSTTLMILYSIILCISNICFVFSGLYKLSEGIWLCCTFAGVGKAVISPSLYTLIGESFFPVTGRIAAYFIMTESLGSAFSSALIGYLMDSYSTMYLLYVLSLESLVIFILILVCNIIQNNIKHSEQQMSHPIDNK